MHWYGSCVPSEVQFIEQSLVLVLFKYQWFIESSLVHCHFSCSSFWCSSVQQQCQRTCSTKDHQLRGNNEHMHSSNLFLCHQNLITTITMFYHFEILHVHPCSCQQPLALFHAIWPWPNLSSPKPYRNPTWSTPRHQAVSPPIVHFQNPDAKASVAAVTLALRHEKPRKARSRYVKNKTWNLWIPMWRIIFATLFFI